MKKIVYILLVNLLLATTFSCTSDFLNDPTPTDNADKDIIYGSVDGAMAYMSGIIRKTRGQYTSTDSGNIGSLLFTRTVKGNDIIISNNWFQWDYENENREPTYRRTQFTWQFPYEIINRFNVFIHEVKKSTNFSAEEKNYLLGQAYAYRAYFYFQLSLEFQHTYSYDKSLPAPPIYTDSEEDILNQEGKPMSTMEDLYKFIVTDLTNAVNISSTTRVDKSYFNKQASAAVLAQVYQVMGNWSEASKYAKIAYGSISTALSAADYKNGFNNMSSVEWILASPQSEDQSAYYYTAPFAFIDHTTQSYKNAFINEELVNKFSATDVRKMFSKNNSIAAVNPKDFRIYTTTKFKFTFASHVPLIRTAEMILIDAEANYRLGNETEAHNLLYAIQHNRDANAVQSSNSGNALLEEILLERRKELYGENGVEWFDAKRLRRGITRTGNHRAFVNLDPDDKRFFLKIPQKEIDANVNIDDSVNEGR